MIMNLFVCFEFSCREIAWGQCAISGSKKEMNSLLG